MSIFGVYLKCVYVGISWNFGYDNLVIVFWDNQYKDGFVELGYFE